MTDPVRGRSLNRVESVIMGIVVVGTGVLAPNAHRALIEAVMLVPLTLYQAWVSKDRLSYIFIGIALVLVLLALAYAPAAPTGSVPD